MTEPERCRHTLLTPGAHREGDMKILTEQEMDNRTGANRKCRECGELMRHWNHDLSNSDGHVHKPLRTVDEITHADDCGCSLCTGAFV